jgi:hypothetical protein
MLGPLTLREQITDRLRVPEEELSIKFGPKRLK